MTYGRNSWKTEITIYRIFLQISTVLFALELPMRQNVIYSHGQLVELYKLVYVLPEKCVTLVGHPL